MKYGSDKVLPHFGLENSIYSNVILLVHPKIPNPKEMIAKSDCPSFILSFFHLSFLVSYRVRAVKIASKIS
ncbi:hypothetical protein GCE9029_02594 [Grimontia celer]|uniref:Uncharacterized protein n=1 Tax=Grimontia celer TaxID=1796497 RepID=A0A128F3N7_9GAMM|nr:hypothetical protein GCE9029_02594 [Grimontia celer]